MSNLPPLPAYGHKPAGYTTGLFTAEDMRAYAAAAVAKERERLEPVSMALCELHSVVLRVGVPYVFRPVGDCQTCAKMFAQAVEAYGPTGGSIRATPA